MRDLNEWNLLYWNDGHNETNGLTVFVIMANLITLAYLNEEKETLHPY